MHGLAAVGGVPYLAADEFGWRWVLHDWTPSRLMNLGFILEQVTGQSREPLPKGSPCFPLRIWEPGGQGVRRTQSLLKARLPHPQGHFSMSTHRQAPFSRAFERGVIGG